ncbi:MAG: molybdenum cofactor biosynthesis protein MoaE [Chloroflexi bacterium]|nr:molybdenum cofactor biosynthesis protein MoaE [Chloroflexota bacterium]
MAITLLYFSILRTRTGLARETLEVSGPISVGQLRQVLVERHPALTRVLPSAVAAINRDFASDETMISDGDEVALFPPVSGGADPGPTVFRITQDPIELNDVLAELTLPTTGAACVFTGMVLGETRRGEEHSTTALEYEAYQPMAEAKLHQVAEEIRARWPSVEGIAIVQRVGRLDPGTPTVLIACTAAHRDTGVFEAARYGIDRLKQIVPVWKKEIGPDGETWVEGDYRPKPQDRHP